MKEIVYYRAIIKRLLRAIATQPGAKQNDELMEAVVDANAALRPSKPSLRKVTHLARVRKDVGGESHDTDSWFRGYACAVSTLQRMDGSTMLTTEVEELMKAGGLTRAACEAAAVDPYDMEALFPGPQPVSNEGVPRIGLDANGMSIRDINEACGLDRFAHRYQNRPTVAPAPVQAVKLSIGDPFMLRFASLVDIDDKGCAESLREFYQRQQDGRYIDAETINFVLTVLNAATPRKPWMVTMFLEIARQCREQGVVVREEVRRV